MKSTALGILLFALASSAVGQETEHFTVRLSPTNAPSQVVGRGDLRLTGTHVFMFVEFPTITFAVASVHGPAAPGSDGPSFIRYENLNGCGGADSSCTLFVETNLTAAQATMIRAGLAYMLVDDFYRGQVAPNPLCESPGTGVIHFQATLRGRVSLQNRTVVEWGKATFVLTGHLLSYRIDLPAIAGQYLGLINEEGIYTPFGGGLYSILGTLDCGPSATNPPPIMGGFDSFPRCVQEGSICLPEEILPSFLAGNWTAAFVHSSGMDTLGPILAVDTDRDQIPDHLDACPDTPPGAVVNASGCSIEQLVPCDGPWRNHGEYVSRVKEVTAEFVKAGSISEAQRQTLVSRAAKSNCGR